MKSMLEVGAMLFADGGVDENGNLVAGVQPVHKRRAGLECVSKSINPSES